MGGGSCAPFSSLSCWHPAVRSSCHSMRKCIAMQLHWEGTKDTNPGKTIQRAVKWLYPKEIHRLCSLVTLHRKAGSPCCRCYQVSKFSLSGLCCFLSLVYTFTRQVKIQLPLPGWVSRLCPRPVGYCLLGDLHWTSKT